MDTAYFVKRPRTIADLQKPHLMDAEQSYEIVAEVTLSVTEYENFVTDMLADRQFIKDNTALCGEGTIMRCIFVHRRGSTEGVLIVPEHNRILTAAYLP